MGRRLLWHKASFTLGTNDSIIQCSNILSFAFCSTSLQNNSFCLFPVQSISQCIRSPENMAKHISKYGGINSTLIAFL